MLPYGNSKVSLELREFINDVDIWNNSTFPFYEETARETFKDKFEKHFYFRQIGFETVDRFKFHLHAKLAEIMPYYNQMWNSIKIMDAVTDPFGNLDVVETYEETSTGTSTENVSNEGDVTKVDTLIKNTTETADDSKTTSDEFERKFSNTPQGSIANLDNYLTEASTEKRDITENADRMTTVDEDATNNVTETATYEGEASSTSTGTIKHTLTRKGNQGVNTYAHDMIEFRKSFVNIDMMILTDLECLFLQIY